MSYTACLNPYHLERFKPGTRVQWEYNNVLYKGVTLSGESSEGKPGFEPGTFPVEIYSSSDGKIIYGDFPVGWVHFTELKLYEEQRSPQINDSEMELGRKDDGEKPRMGLLPSDWLLGVAQVLTFGAKKYDAHNWAKGIEFERLISAAMRHLAAFNRGEDSDPETGLSHLLHASCCLAFLFELQKLDDRRKVVNETK